MASAEDQRDQATGKPAAGKPLSPAAERALAEAAQRRAEIDRKAADRPKEAGGPPQPAMATGKRRA